MAFIPVGKNIIVEPVAIDKTDGGVYLPDEALPAQQCGKVLAVNPKCEFGILVGQFIWYRRYNGLEMNIKGKKITVIPETEVLFVDTKGVE